MANVLTLDPNGIFQAQRLATMQELANLSKLENSLRLHLKTKIVRKNAIKKDAENAKTAQLQTYGVRRSLKYLFMEVTNQ